MAFAESMRNGCFIGAIAAVLGAAACGSSPAETSTTTSASSGGGGSGGVGGSGGTSSSGGSGGTADGGGGTGGSIAPSPHDWIGIIGTGQSLSVGAAGAPVVSSAQPYKNLKLFDSSPPPAYDGAGDMLSLVPLTAPLRPYDPGQPPIVYPNNIAGETPNEGMGNQLSASTLEATGTDWVTVQTNVGESGQGIVQIEKNGLGKAYAATLYEAAAIKDLAAKEGKTYGVGAVFLTHGETDADNKDYATRVAQLAADYNADLKAITGQAEEIPMFASQQGTFPQALGPSFSTLAVWQLAAALPGAFFCVGPKYQYEYAADKVHLTAPSYRRLGEKYAEAYFKQLVTKEGWAPLQPTSAKLSGTTITVDFQVPVPPLQWEETQPLAHQVTLTQWAAGHGFEVADSTGVLPITAVAIQDSAVVITLAAPPAGTDLLAMYALFQDVDGFHGGEAVGRHGQLRDSDPFVGYSARAIPCAVTQGSNVVTAVTPGDFADRTKTELASAQGLPPGAVVAQVAGDAITLSAPWQGPSGQASVTFQNDHRNYAVQFALAVQPAP
jgi:hypothetical protein